MKLTAYFFNAPSGTESIPYMFSEASGEFAGLAEAVGAAKGASKRNGAHSFIVEDEAGDTEQWINDEEGWRRRNA